MLASAFRLGPSVNDGPRPRARPQVQGDFGFRMPDVDENTEHRLTDPALGGGATLDIGVYPLSCVLLAFGATRPSVAAIAAGGGRCSHCVPSPALCAYVPSPALCADVPSPALCADVPSPALCADVPSPARCAQAHTRPQLRDRAPPVEMWLQARGDRAALPRPMTRQAPRRRPRSRSRGSRRPPASTRRSG
jgi:hypothetical protein